MNKRFEYKMLTQRDTKFSGTFDLQGLESALNEHAAQGWRLAEGLVVTSFWKSGKAEIVLVLERPSMLANLKGDGSVDPG
jgi:Domain of unknown function (DUF4177)